MERADASRVLRDTGVFIAGVALAVSACTAPAAELPSDEETEGSVPTIEQVLERETEAWMRIPGVVGTGLGLCGGQPCIKIFAGGAPGSLDAVIADEVDGYPVVVESTGRFTPRDTS